MSKYHELGRHIVPKVEVYFDVTPTVFGVDEVNSIQILEELSDETGMLSANEIVVVLDNADGSLSPTNNASMKIGTRVDVSLGIWTYVAPPGTSYFAYTSFGTTYKIQDIDAPTESNEITLVLNDLMFTLGDLNIPASELYTNVSLTALFTELFTLAGLTSSDYTICPSCDTYVVPYGWSPSGKFKDVAQRLAEAGNKYVHVGRDDKIHVIDTTETGTLYAHSLTDSNQLIELFNSPRYASLYSQASVAHYKYTPEIAGQVMAISEFSVPGVLNKLKVDRPLLRVERVDIKKGTNSRVNNLVHTAEELTLGVTAPSVETVDIEVLGTVLEPVISEATAEDSTVPTTNTYVVDNPLIQSEIFAGTYATSILARKSNPLSFMSLTTRGNPEIVIGNRISTSYTKYGLDNTVIVVHRSMLNYDGGLDGSIEGYRVV